MTGDRVGAPATETGPVSVQVWIMPDGRQLSDHEWKLREAEAGRAFYVPGRSREQVDAEIAERLGTNKAVSLKGNKAEFNDFAEAAESMSVLMQHAETTFGFLARIHADHDHDGHIGLEAIATLCSRALASAGEKEGDVVQKLVDRLRTAAEEKESAA